MGKNRLLISSFTITVVAASFLLFSNFALAGSVPFFGQESPGVDETEESGDYFGSILASGDFDGDGCSDLATGNPFEDVGGSQDAGLIQIFWCPDIANADFSDDTVYHQDSPGWPGANEDYDRLGNALAVGDFNNDGYDDLAVASAREDLGSKTNAGMVTVAYGNSSGSLGSFQTIHQGQSNIVGASEPFDYFGYSLAAGDLNGDGYDDLVIGAPYEDIGSIKNAGSISILYGSDTKLRTDNDQFFSQNTAGVNGGAEDGDSFGRSLAIGDVNGDGFGDVIIGVPYEDIGSIQRCGMIQILWGSNTRVSSSGDIDYHQDKPGIPGVCEANDRFGTSLSAGDIGTDGKADIAIGIPYEKVGSIVDAGWVLIIHSTGSYQSINQGSPGVIGALETGDRFGQQVLLVDFTDDDSADLIVGTIGEDIGSIRNVGVVHTFESDNETISSVNDKTFFPGSSRLPGTTSPDGYFGYFHAITYLETSSHIFAGDEGGLTSDNGGSIYYFQP